MGLPAGAESVAGFLRGLTQLLHICAALLALFRFTVVQSLSTAHAQRSHSRHTLVPVAFPVRASLVHGFRFAMEGVRRCSSVPSCARYAERRV